MKLSESTYGKIRASLNGRQNKRACFAFDIIHGGKIICGDDSQLPEVPDVRRKYCNQGFGYHRIAQVEMNANNIRVIMLMISFCCVQTTWGILIR